MGRVAILYKPKVQCETGRLVKRAIGAGLEVAARECRGWSKG